MAFKKPRPTQTVPDSPEKIILDLPRRKIPSSLDHQGEILRSYEREAKDKSDVCIQLPTGAGKTFVALMIAEWRRRAFSDKVLYLCPTKQLVFQVVEQAQDRYGLAVNGFTGSRANYEPSAKTQYHTSERIAIATYSSLFNSNPFFDNPDLIIFDDAHASESYISSNWSIRISQHEQSHRSLHDALSCVLREHITPLAYSRLSGHRDEGFTLSWVDKLPSPVFFRLANEIRQAIDQHIENTDLRFRWAALKDRLEACHLYIAPSEILIRPLIPPTWAHSAFRNAKQRIFMSATPGDGGDLERLTGIPSIYRLKVPDGWDRQGIGRRFFVFPSLSLNENEVKTIRSQLVELAGRSIMLVPSKPMAQSLRSEIETTTVSSIFEASDIEKSKQVFINSPKAVAIMEGRYDGIDFPGDECRALFIEGLPKATNLQENFLMSRMGANALYKERIKARVLQAMGRCTRSMEDYSIIVATGSGLPEYLLDPRRRTCLHPELQAEIEFGIEQSSAVTADDIIDNARIFLENGDEWEAANQDIIDMRNRKTSQDLPFLSALSDAVQSEIAYQRLIWQGDYHLAYDQALRVIGSLTPSELQGYRALWHYLAGSAAYIAAQTNPQGAQAHPLRSKARDHFDQSKRAAIAIPWLATLSNQVDNTYATVDIDSLTLLQLENVELLLERMGTTSDYKFVRLEKDILEGMYTAEAFEQAHKKIGELIGFDARKVEQDASPDPWWMIDGVCFVFEDHANAQPSSMLDATKARQVASHPNWIRANVPEARSSEILSVLVTPVTTAAIGAVPHLVDFCVWSLDEFREWATNAIATVREIRRTFIEPGDSSWRLQAQVAFEDNGLSARSLRERFQASPANQVLKSPH
jgi:Rad3-related DNA helicase